MQPGLLQSPYDFSQLQQQFAQPKTMQVPQSQGLLSRIVSGVVAPFKTIGKAVTSAPAAIAREVQGKPISDIQQNVFDTTNSGQIAKKIIGSTAQIGADIVPGAEEGLLAKAGTGLVRGAVLGGGAALANNERVSDIAKNAAIGGVTGAVTEPIAQGIIGKVFRGGTTSAADNATEEPVMKGINELTGGDESASSVPASQPEAKGNFFQNLAKSIQKGVINPKVNPSPFGAGQEDSLVQYLKDNNLIKAGDSASGIYSKLQGHFSDLQNQINDTLGKDTTSISAKDLSQHVEDAVNSGNRFGGTNTAAQTAVENTKEILANAADENGNLDSKTIYSLKNQIQDELGRAFDKISKNAPLSGNEDALMAIRNTLNDSLPDSVKGLGKAQSMLYDASPGLAKSAAEKLPIRTPTVFGTLPGTRIPSAGLSNAIQGAKTGTAAALEKIGDAGATVADKLPAPVGDAVSNATVPAAVNAVEDNQPTTTRTVSLPTDNVAPNVTPTSSPTSSFGLSSDQVAQGMMQALAAGDTKSFSTLNTLYGIIKSEEKASQPSASLVGKSANATQALAGLSKLSDSFGATDLTGKGILSKVAADSPLGGTSVKQINDAITEFAPIVAKATGGTAADTMAYFPKITDSKQVAQAKIATLQQMVNQYMQDQQSQEQTSPDLSSLVGATQ